MKNKNRSANEAGYHPEIMLASRRVNESMSEFVAHELIRMMVNKDIKIRDANILVLGVTFKENCPDLRNTKVVDIVNILREYDVNIDIYDPWVDNQELQKEYKVTTIDNIESKLYDAIIVAVAHNEFKDLELNKITNQDNVVFDLKSLFPKSYSDRRL